MWSAYFKQRRRDGGGNPREKGWREVSYLGRHAFIYSLTGKMGSMFLTVGVYTFSLSSERFFPEKAET